LFITAQADNESRIEALEEGALDCIVKPVNNFELQCKIDNILSYKKSVLARERSNETRCMEELAANKFRALGLSSRQIDVALMLSRGKSRKDIACQLGIATATAKRHIENIYDKLGLQDRYQLFAEYLTFNISDGSNMHSPPQ